MSHPDAPQAAQRQLAVRNRPAGPCVMYQRWRRLAFLHWSFAPEEIAPTLPAGLSLDTFDGHAWVGIVPFAMEGVRPRWSCALPLLSRFPEINLRTYVIGPDGTPGVWFYSLDASRLLAVLVARLRFQLPYYWAEMKETPEEDGFIYYESRRWRRQESQCFRYRAQGPLYEAKPGSLEFFLIERYALFARRRNGRIRKGLVHHPPYTIQAAELALFDDGLFEFARLPRPGREPDHVLYSPGVDVEIFGIE
ncbi:MAG: DUF2071 domain-containing protein [Planctomycetota bacterium]